MKKSERNKDDFYLNLGKLKENYEGFREKYELPEFQELNKTFDIEDIETNTEFLLRKIRRMISEKLSGFLRFVEIILNPSSAPLFFFKLIKKLENSDKEILNEIYETLGNLELESGYLDLDYSEEKEAEFIKKSFEIFKNNIKIKLIAILEKLGNRRDDNKKENNGSYFG